MTKIPAPFGGKKVVNLTPHPVRLLDDDGDVIAEWESAGSLRIRYEFIPGDEPGTRTAELAGIDGLGLAEEADVVIVSRAMAMVETGLTGQVYYPDGEVRDPEDPRIVIGCRYLSAFTDPAHDVAIESLAIEAFDYGLSNMYGHPGLSHYRAAVARARGLS